MTIYERIKKRRKELGLTADQVADSLGVSRATVYRYESSDIEKIPFDIIVPLSEVLHCTPEYIMGWHEADDTSPDTDKALQLYELYKNAIPQVQEAVDVLLKQSQSDS